MQTDIQLKIRNYFKAIPYGAVERESSRSSNHGFKNVKGRPKEAEAIPELQHNDALKSAILRLNETTTPFFTIGCESKMNNEGGVWWMRGYIEFAFNYPQLVTDAQNYFKLFYDFNFSVFDSKLDEPVQFSWELEGAAFRDNIRCDGFSVTVWITTKDLPDERQTRGAWERAVLFLTDFLKRQPPIRLPMIYSTT